MIHEYASSGGLAIFTTPQAKASSAAAAKPLKATQVNDPDPKVDPWAEWGEGNTFPQDVQEDLRKNMIINRALMYRSSTHFGQGVIACRRQVVNNAIVDVPELYEPFETWKRSLPGLKPFDLQQQGLIRDLETYWNGGVELIWDVPRTKVVGYRHIKVAHTRLGRMDSAGRIGKAYFSAEWPRPMESNRVELPTLDEYKPAASSSFYVPCRYLTSEDTLYYELAGWNAAREVGWTEIAELAPKLKKAVLQNAGILRYHIQIPYSYWSKKFKDWDTLEANDQAAKQKALFDSINENLFKLEKSGKSIFTHFESNEQNGHDYSGWKIEVIDNKMSESNVLNVDSKTANQEQLFAVGVAPSLLGLLPGSNEAGSGSNINAHFAALQAEMYWYQEVSLMPINLVSRLNGWDKDIVFRYRPANLVMDQNLTAPKQ